MRTGKKQRITIIECENDINIMIDLAKVADLCLILVDASIGFEMETFEFLSILKAHGFPNVMGVLSHLDFFKESSSMRKVKKGLKKRFQYEVGGDYKLFYLSGLRNELYP
jgi:ribosome biogenesis protein BMS1